jgi:hypothetical protein
LVEFTLGGVNMKRFILVTVTTFVVGLLTFTSVKRLEVRSQQIEKQPFTAVLIEDRYSPTGVKGYTEYVTHAVRNDGSRVDVYRRKAPDGNWGFPRVIVNVQARTRTAVDPATESVTTYPLSDGAVAAFTAPANSCTPQMDTDQPSIIGYKVGLLREDHPGGIHADHADKWAAIALDCFPLREVDTVTSGPALGAHNEREALIVMEGEPAASLFEVPSSYVERSPSEVSVEFARRFPGQPTMRPETGSVLDQSYQRQQRNQ